MGEIGLAFLKLVKFENEEAMSNAQRIHAADIKRIATAAVKASRFHQESNAQSVKHLVLKFFYPLCMLIIIIRIKIMYILTMIIEMMSESYHFNVIMNKPCM